MYARLLSVCAVQDAPEPNTAMDIFSWLEDSASPAKWAAVAEQAGVILEALDDLEIESAYLSICHEADARIMEGERGYDCDSANALISEKSLLEVQVFFDVARDMADKVAAALG
jgi:hypothetical protein